MNALERRYRRALRTYPIGWRRANEEVVLGTLLERAADEGRAGPGAREVADLRFNGWRARIRAITARIPVAARDAAGSAALGIAAAFSAFALVTGELGQLSEVPSGPWPVGPFRTPAGPVFALWVCTFLVELLRLRAAARWLRMTAIVAGIAIVPVFAGTFSWRVDGMDEAISVLPSQPTFIFLTVLGVVVTLGESGRRGSGRNRRALPQFSPRAGLIGALVTTIAIGFVGISVRATTTLTGFGDSTLWLGDLALTVVLAGTLGVAAYLLATGRPAAGTSVALASLPLLVTLLYVVWMSHGMTLSVGGVITWAATAAVVVAAGWGAITAWRRPPRAR